jgi:hypothetical protein
MISGVFYCIKNVVVGFVVLEGEDFDAEYCYSTFFENWAHFGNEIRVIIDNLRMVVVE